MSELYTTFHKFLASRFDPSTDSDTNSLYGDILTGRTIVLYITYTGSRLYGTNTQNSDTDLKVVYLPNIVDVISGNAKFKNNMKSTSNEDVKNSSSDVDVEFISFHNFVNDVHAGQTYALEILFSVYTQYTTLNWFNTNSASHGESYRDLFVRICDRLRSTYVVSDCSAAVGFAISQMTKYGLKGARLKGLISIQQWLNEYTAKHRIAPDTIIDTWLNDLKYDYERWSDAYLDSKSKKYIKFGTYVVDPATGKTANCVRILDKHLVPTHRQFEFLFKGIDTYLNSYGNRTKAAADMDGVDFKSVHHACRIIAQTLELQNTGFLRLPLYENESYDFIMAVKRAELDMHAIEVWLNDNIRAVEALTEDGLILPKRDRQLSDKLHIEKMRWCSRLYLDSAHEQLGFDLGKSDA